MGGDAAASDNRMKRLTLLLAPSMATLTFFGAAFAQVPGGVGQWMRNHGIPVPGASNTNSSTGDPEADRGEREVVETNDAAAPADTRTADSARALFLKVRVTGEDLAQELEMIKAAAGASTATTALADRVGESTAQLLAQRSPFQFSWSLNTTDILPESLVGRTTAYSGTLLGGYLATVTADHDVLRKETVLLDPRGASMTLKQQQSVLTMASLVIAARIAKQTLQSAKKDFEGLETEYTALLDRRQRAAALMADVLDLRRQAIAARSEAEARDIDKDLGQWLTKEDLRFIDSFGAEKSLREFVNDVGLQNLALKFLQHTDPAAYVDYRAARDGLVGRSRAYLRTTAGVAAFGGFSVLFVEEIAKWLPRKDVTQVLTATPFAIQYLREALPLMQLSAETLYTGVVLEPAKARLTYRVSQNGQTVDVATAKEVFDSIQRAGDAPRLKDALFRDDVPGFLYRVYACDRGQAGYLVDQSVPDVNRKKFADSYLDRHGPGVFSFAAALLDETMAPQSPHLAEPLLFKDQRRSSDSVPIREIQILTAENYAKWNNPALTRLILANSDGSYAQMQLGNTLIRLIPSMATVYGYEAYADSCVRTAAAESASATAIVAKPRVRTPRARAPDFPPR